MTVWTPELVRARFHEAADTERSLPMPRSASGKGFWPAYHYTAEDRSGWTDDTKADDADRWARDRKLTRDAISRHDECLNWSMTMLTNEVHRHIVWKWAFCQANGRSFAKVCQRNGWNRNTAYSRLDRCFVKMCDVLLGDDTIPRLPDEKFLERPEISAIEAISSASPVRETRAHPPFRTDRHIDTLTTAAAIAAFSQHMVETNSARRKMQQRRAAKVSADQAA